MLKKSQGLDWVGLDWIGLDCYGLGRCLEMAVAMAKHGIASMALQSCSPLTSLSGRAGMRSSAASKVVTVGVGSRRILAPLSVVWSPIQGRAQLVSSPRDVERGRSSSSGSGGRACFDDAMALLASAPVLPKLVVLDLDFTVWPFYCYKRQLSGSIDPPNVYPEVVDIVKALAANKVEMAIASRSPSASVAKRFLEQLSLSEYFPSKEIYFTLVSKTKHFNALKKKTGIPYNSILFFDDEVKNIVTAAKLGVTGIVVDEGLNLKSLESGLNAFASKN